jgi:hypothetical protein
MHLFTVGDAYGMGIYDKPVVFDAHPYILVNVYAGLIAMPWATVFTPVISNGPKLITNRITCRGTGVVGLNELSAGFGK